MERRASSVYGGIEGGQELLIVVQRRRVYAVMHGILQTSGVLKPVASQGVQLCRSLLLGRSSFCKRLLFFWVPFSSFLALSMAFSSHVYMIVEEC